MRAVEGVGTVKSVGERLTPKVRGVPAALAELQTHVDELEGEVGDLLEALGGVLAQVGAEDPAVPGVGYASTVGALIGEAATRVGRAVDQLADMRRRLDL